MTYNSAWHTVVRKTAEAMPPFQAPSTYPNTTAFAGLGPVHIPDQTPFIIWFQFLLPHTLVRELDCECPVVCIGMHTLVPAC